MGHLKDPSLGCILRGYYQEDFGCDLLERASKATWQQESSLATTSGVCSDVGRGNGEQGVLTSREACNIRQQGSTCSILDLHCTELDRSACIEILMGWTPRVWNGRFEYGI